MALNGPVVMPEAFSGEATDERDWPSYIEYFAECSALNWWQADGQDHRARFLSVRLRGVAQRFASTPPPATRHDFTLFTRAMGERFAPADREALHKLTFKARRQLPDESFAIFADDLRRLVALAFPKAPHDVRMELARDQFVDAVSSVRLQQRLKEDPPASLDAAVRRAVQLEAVWGTAAATPVPSSVPQGADVFAVRDRAPDAHLDLVAAMGSLGLVAEHLSHVADRLARTVDSWEDGAPNRRDRAVRAGPRGSPPPPPRPYGMITCWQCGQPGHVRTNCPNFRGNGMPGNGR